MIFTNNITSIEFAERYEIPHRSVLKAIQRSKKEVEENGDDVYNIDFFEENFTKVKHTNSINRSYEVYDMTENAAHYLLNFFRNDRIVNDLKQYQKFLRWVLEAEIMRRNYADENLLDWYSRVGKYLRAK